MSDGPGIYPSGPNIRKGLLRELDMLEAIADRRDEPEATHMRKAAEFIRWRMIGDGRGCVITTLDPRRDDPEWAAILAPNPITHPDYGGAS